MRSIAKLSTKLFTTGIAFALTMGCAMANTLSEIQVSPENNSYGIVLKTDETATMKKVVHTTNKMVIELKNTDISSSLNTVYNNVSGIENITVQPISKKDVKITLKGRNVSGSKVYFETPKAAVSGLNAPAESISLSDPISSYTPVYDPDAFVEDVPETQTANPQLNEVLTKMHISRAMLVSAKKYTRKCLNKLDSMGINPLTLVGIIVVGAVFALKPRRRKELNKALKNTKIGLSATNSANVNGVSERELDRARNMAAEVNRLTSTRGAEPKGMASAAYGMKAYQQSQRNPYASKNTQTTGITGIPKIQRPSVGTPVKKQTVQSQPVPMKKTPAVQSPIASKRPKVAPSVQPAQSQEADIDSMKFLESITKIYEKNGRTDLAKGLKDNLRKAQLAKV